MPVDSAPLNSTPAAAPAGVEVAWDAHTNLAYTQAAPTIPEALTLHARRMQQRVYRVADSVYCAVGYGLANVIWLVGETGVVVFDCTESVEAAQAAQRDFWRACPRAKTLPTVAVVYTHHHSDHIGGVRAFISPADVQAGTSQVIAHASLLQAVAQNASVVAPILRTRSAYSFGALLESGPIGQVSGGIGPKLVTGTTSFIPPTHCFETSYSTRLGGILIDLVHAPSETDDEIVAWLPELGVLLSAEVIQGECLANVHTLRGTRYRDPVQWVRSIDQMRSRHASQPVQWLVPAHGRPQAGAPVIADLLTAYRDAIAYLHDQSVRWMNQGCTPEELAQRIPGLPEHLASHEWLGEHYGSARHTVRQVFTGLLGWFDGDPATLDPLAPLARAQRWIAVAGGPDALLAQAQQALAKDGLDGARWAAELCSLLVRADSTDLTARSTKAQALRTLGYDTVNINWRNWYLSAAHELEGRYDQLSVAGNALAAPDILAALPAAQLLANLAVRVAAERCLHVHTWLRLAFTDAHNAITLELRHGVLQIHEQAPSTGPGTAPLPGPAHMLTLALPQSGLVQLFVTGPSALVAQLSGGTATLENGELSDLASFFSHFDPRPSKLPRLASR